MHYSSLQINYNSYCKSAQHCNDGTISPYPELKVHTSMSIGTSTTTPNHFSPSTPKCYTLQTGSIYTTSHYRNFIHIWATYLWKWWQQWAWILCLSITAWRWNHHKHRQKINKSQIYKLPTVGKLPRLLGGAKTF